MRFVKALRSLKEARVSARAAGSRFESSIYYPAWLRVDKRLSMPLARRFKAGLHEEFIAMINDARRRFFLYIILFISLAGSHIPAFAADNGNLTASLNGIKNIYVSVRPIENPIVIEAGMDESQLKILAEQQLRKAGIPLLSQEEYDRYKMTLNYPLANLEIRVTVHELEGMDAAAADLTVRVMQVAFLARKPTVQINAPSWESREIGVGRDRDFLEGALEKNVNLFIHDYFSANPQ